METLEYADREIKKTTPRNPTELLPQKFTLQRQSAKPNVKICRNKQKDILKAGKQRESLQSKGMEDSPLKELNEMEVTKLSDIEFKIIIITMLKQLIDKYKELSKNYNSMKNEIKTINKNQEEMNNKISEIKNTLEGITTRLDEAEERISELEDKVERNNQVEQLHKKRLRKNK